MAQLRLFAVLLVIAAINCAVASIPFPWPSLGADSSIECANCLNETMTPVDGPVIKISNNTNVSPVNRTRRDLMGSLFNTTLWSSPAANNATYPSVLPDIGNQYASVPFDNLTSSLNKTLDQLLPPKKLVHPLNRRSMETVFNSSYLLANATPSANLTDITKVNLSMTSNSTLNVSQPLHYVPPQVRSKRGASMPNMRPLPAKPNSSALNETSPRDINILISVVRNPTAIQNINLNGSPDSASNGFGSNATARAKSSSINSSSIVVPLDGSSIGIMIRPVPGQYPPQGNTLQMKQQQNLHHQSGTPHPMRPNFNMPVEPLAIESHRPGRSLPDQDFIQLNDATRARLEDAFERLKNTFGGIGDSLKQLNETLRSFSTTVMNSEAMKNLNSSVHNSDFIKSFRLDNKEN